jgi:hypothetical protein
MAAAQRRAQHAGMLSLALTGAVLAAAGTSDTGGEVAGESASPWHAGGFLFWIIIVVAALAVLALGLLMTTRRERG